MPPADRATSRRALAGGAVALLLLTGCGGGHRNGASATTGTRPAGATRHAPAPTPVVADLPPGVQVVDAASVGGSVSSAALGSLAPIFRRYHWQSGARIGREGVPGWQLVLEVDTFADATDAQRAEAAAGRLPQVTRAPAGARRTPIAGSPPIGAGDPGSHYYGVLDTTPAGDRRATIRFVTGRYIVWIQLAAEPEDPTVWAGTLATRQAKALGGG